MPETTKAYDNKKGLPKVTRSICPECGKIIEAEYYEKDGKVFAKKTCPEHGDYDCLIWSDAKMYLRMEDYAVDGIGLVNPNDQVNPEPASNNVKVVIDGQDIKMHTSTILANLDLTNRCNMTCPICFAEANSAGYVYEPSFDEVIAMMKTLREESPVKCTAIQFAGGEPTIYPRFFDVIKAAKEMGFAQIQVASNGLEFAKSVEFCRKAKEAGLNTIYLSFDGTKDDIYIQARNRKMFHIKEKVIENLRSLEHHPSVVLVPTVVKGMNDDNIGGIMDFAFKNADIVLGVNFQPVAFTGRITREELEKGRFTLTDLVKNFGEQTGYTQDSDWYPVPIVAPVSRFVSALKGKPMVTFTAHPHCGLATYLFKGDDGKVVPIPRFIDVNKLMKGIDEIASNMFEAKYFKKLKAAKALKLLDQCIIESEMPAGYDKKKFKEMIKSILTDKSKKALAEFSWRTMYVGGMHFQDSYNYDLSRVERCAIHYVTPDLRVIPFCAYNSGPEYRVEVEKKYSVPLAEWKEKHKKEAKELEEALITPEDQRPDA